MAKGKLFPILRDELSRLAVGGYGELVGTPLTGLKKRASLVLELAPGGEEKLFERGPARGGHLRVEGNELFIRWPSRVLAESLQEVWHLGHARDDQGKGAGMSFRFTGLPEEEIHRFFVVVEAGLNPYLRRDGDRQEE